MNNDFVNLIVSLMVISTIYVTDTMGHLHVNSKRVILLEVFGKDVRVRALSDMVELVITTP